MQFRPPFAHKSTAWSQSCARVVRRRITPMLRTTGFALVLVSIAAGSLVAACGAKKNGSGFETAAKPRGADGGLLDEGEEGEEGTNPGPFGEVADAGVPAKPACVNLQCKQVLCTGTTKTTVSGTIFD